MSDLKEIAGRFVVEEKLVTRPNATIYRAKDKKLGDVAVAVKVFVDRPSERKEILDSYREEIKILRQASHVGLVPVIAGDEEGDWLYLVMELIQGQSLKEKLSDAGGKLPIEQAVKIAKEIGLALHELHQEKGVHGHLDTRAVLFKGADVRVAGYCPRAIDRLQSMGTSTGRLTIQPAYISPEQLGQGSVIDCRADIYALSVMLFEMVTGEVPFKADHPLQTAMLRLTLDAPKASSKNSEVPALIDAAISKGMAKDPAGRFANMKEFIDMITGGKEEVKNPLHTVGVSMPAQAARLSGTETMPTSMSAETIKQMLAAHSPSTAPKKQLDSGHTPAAGNTQPIESAQTVMGLDVQSMLTASLVVVAGDKRGEKFVADKPSMMIGSDSACDILVSDKDVPARYAIVLKREKDYFVAPLSPEGITLNGEHKDDAKEVVLKRGDVITVGNTELRYVAPGEVFTLRDDVADRVIDRPKSKLPMILGATAGLLAIFGFVLFTSYSDSVASKAKSKAKTAAEKQQAREELIAKLLKEGDQYFKEGRLIEPAGDNALQRFQDVVELSPENSYAKRRISEINERAEQIAKDRERLAQVQGQIDRLIATGNRYMDSKNYVSPPGKNAKDAFKEVLALDSANQIAKTKLSEIDSILAAMVGDVNRYLASAKVYKALGQYVAPTGENALEQIQKIRDMDPDNKAAKDLLYEMAAENLYYGDVAKSEAKSKLMKDAYLTAQAMGVNPEYISSKMKGADIMQRSKSSIIIVQNDSDKNKEDDTEGGKYLSKRELEQRVANLSLKNTSSGDGGRRFIEVRDR